MQDGWYSCVYVQYMLVRANVGDVVNMTLDLVDVLSSCFCVQRIYLFGAHTG